MIHLFKELGDPESDRWGRDPNECTGLSAADGHDQQHPLRALRTVRRAQQQDVRELVERLKEEREDEGVVGVEQEENVREGYPRLPVCVEPGDSLVTGVQRREGQVDSRSDSEEVVSRYPYR